MKHARLRTTTPNDTMRQFRHRLFETFGDRLQGVVLFGSEARGESAADSDIDLLVLLNGPIDLVRDLETIVDTLYPLQQQHPNRPIHALPIDIQEYEAGKRAVYRNAQREGILV